MILSQTHRSNDGISDDFTNVSDSQELMKCCKNSDIIVSWIPVADQLPDLGDIVIVSTSTDEVVMAKYIGDGVWADASGNSISDDVLAWMPKIQPFNVTDLEAISILKENRDWLLRNAIHPRMTKSLDIAINRMETILKVLDFLKQESSCINNGSQSYKNSMRILRHKLISMLYGDDTGVDPEHSESDKTKPLVGRADDEYKR